MEHHHNTLIVNMLAGPSAGKTTCAWSVASELKKQGYVTEYVSEYAKELVWDGNMELLDGSMEHQVALLNEQEYRLRRLIGKVDFIVTDSPLLLNALYFKAQTPEAGMAYADTVYRRFSSYNNFCVFVQRGTTFETEGRIHNAQQSQAIDQQIKEILNRYHIYYGSYSYENIHYIVPNCIKTFERINAEQKKIRDDHPEGFMTLEELAESNRDPSYNSGHISMDELSDEEPVI